MREVVSAAGAILRRDARVYFSYRYRLVSQTLSTLLTLALFSEVARLVKSGEFATPGAYFQFAAIGLALLPMLRSVLVVGPAALREELVAGTFERLAVSAFGPVRALLSGLAFPILIGVLNGILTLVLAAAFFHLHLVWHTAALAIPVAVLGALALAPFAALMLAVTLLVKQVAAGAGLMLAAFSLVSGAYFPVSQLPGWIRWASEAQPLTPALDLLRHLLAGAPLKDPAAGSLAHLALFALVGLPLGALVLSRACGLARRLGILFEY
jgi:ABC-type multidrug transport system permease subunit